MVEIAAVRMPVNDILNIGRVEPLLMFKPLFIELGRGFKMGTPRNCNNRKTGGSV
jgi:hypothetical protein